VRLRAGHFERWLTLWRGTVDELFAGERAELAKAHAVRVAEAFQARLEGKPAPVHATPDSTILALTLHGPAVEPDARG
jgi:hemoglobin